MRFGLTTGLGVTLTAVLAVAAAMPAAAQSHDYYDAPESYGRMWGDANNARLGATVSKESSARNPDWTGDTGDDALSWDMAPVPGITWEFTVDIFPTANTSANPDDYGFYIWIDENDNGTFEHPAELVIVRDYDSNTPFGMLSNRTSPLAVELEYDVPADFPGDALKMRIAFEEDWSDLIPNDGDIGDGEVEDHRVEVMELTDPMIWVRGPDDRAILGGSSVSIGTGLAGRDLQTVPFSIANIGASADLTVSRVEVVGHTGLRSAPVVTPGGSATIPPLPTDPLNRVGYIVEYEPNGGAFSMTLSITHDADNGASPYTFTFFGDATLAGLYTVVNGSPNADFADLGAAIDALSRYGVRAPTTFEVYDDGGPFVSRTETGISYRIGDFPGSFANPVTFRAAWGESPVVTGAGATGGTALGTAALNLAGAKNVKIEGFTFDGRDAAGQPGAALGVAIYSESLPATLGIVLDRCRFIGFHGPALTIFGVSQATMPGDILITNNVFSDNLGEPTGVHRGILSYARATNVRVIHNSFVRREGTGAVIHHVADGTAIDTFTNNIIASWADGSLLFDTHPQLAGAPAAGDGNIWYAADGARFGLGVFGTFSQWRSVGLDQSGRVADPRFIDAAGDFRLRRGSNAVDNGLAGTGVTVDHNGDARPAGPLPEPGAWEFPVNSPQISVRAVPGPATAPGGTASIGTISRTQTIPLTFEITNYGSADLVLPPAAVVLRSADGVTATITQPGELRLAPFESTTLVVDARATRLGDVRFSLEIFSNDTKVPEFVLNAEGVGADTRPLIKVYRNPLRPLAPGGSDDLGMLPRGLPTTFTYTIENVGSAVLTLNGSPDRVRVDNIVDAAVSVDQTQLPLTLAPRERVTFAVTIDSNAGSFDFDLTILNDGAVVSAQTFVIHVTGSAVDLPVLEPAADLVSAGGVQVGDPAEVPVLLRNLGNRELTISRFVLDDPTGAFRYLRAQPALPALGGQVVLEPAGQAGDSITMIFEFAPDDPGAYEATLKVYSDDRNDADAVYDIVLTGIAVGGGGSTSSSGCVVGTESDAGALTGLLVLLALAAVAGALRRRI
jgi:hypothetical protein